MSAPESNAPKARRAKLVLFVAGGSRNSLLALANLRRMFGPSRATGSQFEVVDVIEEPDRALAARVFVVPTLLYADRDLHQRLIGDLDSADDLRAFLEIGEV